MLDEPCDIVRHLVLDCSFQVTSLNDLPTIGRLPDTVRDQYLFRICFGAFCPRGDAPHTSIDGRSRSFGYQSSFNGGSINGLAVRVDHCFYLLTLLLWVIPAPCDKVSVPLPPQRLTWSPNNNASGAPMWMVDRGGGVILRPPPIFH